MLSWMDEYMDECSLPPCAVTSDALKDSPGYWLADLHVLARVIQVAFEL